MMVTLEVPPPSQRRSCGTAAVAGDQYESDAQRQRHEQWALPLYAAAAETGQTPPAVTAAEPGCRLGQNADQFVIWLGTQLQTTDHPSRRPGNLADEARGAAPPDWILVPERRHAQRPTLWHPQRAAQHTRSRG